MLEVAGDSSRGGDWALVRLTVDGDRIVAADAPGLARPLAGLTLLEAAAVPGERACEPGRVGGDDPVALDREPHEREVAPARRVSDHLTHASQRTGRVSVDWSRSTLCVALRVNVNQRSREGSLCPV